MWKVGWDYVSNLNKDIKWKSDKWIYIWISIYIICVNVVFDYFYTSAIYIILEIYIRFYIDIALKKIVKNFNLRANSREETLK